MASTELKTVFVTCAIDCPPCGAFTTKEQALEHVKSEECHYWHRTQPLDRDVFELEIK